MTTGAREHIASGIGWLGAVPADWEVMRLRRLLYVRSGDFISADTFLPDGVPVFGGNGLRGYTDKPNTGADTLLIGRYGALCGNVHHVRQPVWATEHAFRVFKRRPFCTRFMFYVLVAVNLNQFSARAAQPGLNSTIVEEQFLAVPSPLEQQAVADFLDHETAKIDLLVDKQGAFVAHLDEHRRALIAEAVTRGVDTEAEMRRVDLDGLDAVPAHWAVKRLRHIAADITVGVVVTPSKYYAEVGVPALRSLNVREMEISRDDLVFFDEASHRLLSKSALHEADLVAVRTGKPGTTAVIGPDLAGSNCIDLIIIRKSSRFESRFLAYVMNSEFAHAQYVKGSEGALQLHFNIETAKDLLVPLPPVEEQATIVEYLDARLARIDALRVRSVEMMDRLRERRAALITAAVTGHIDMRSAAPRQAAE